MDLKGFTGEDLLRIAFFLKTVSDHYELQHRVPVLILQNGTTYKFNKIFSGVERFFKNMGGAEVIYQHTGKQTPASPYQSLRSLSSNTLKQIFSQVDKGITENDSQSIGTFKIGNESLEVSQPKSPKILRDLIQKAEFQECRDELEGKWYRLEKKVDSFLGIKHYNQWMNIHYDSLLKTDVHLQEESLEQIVFLEIEGMRYGGGKALVEFCQKLPSLRAIRICNSYSDSDDFMELCRAKRTLSSDDSESFLSKTNVFFVDVETAGMKGGIKKLKKNLAKEGLSSFLPYFLWVPSIWSHKEDFTSLGDSHQKRHELFWVFGDYLALLKEEHRYHSEKDQR